VHQGHHQSLSRCTQQGEYSRSSAEVWEGEYPLPFLTVPSSYLIQTTSFWTTNIVFGHFFAIQMCFPCSAWLKTQQSLPWVSWHRAALSVICAPSCLSRQEHHPSTDSLSWGSPGWHELPIWVRLFFRWKELRKALHTCMRKRWFMVIWRW